MALISIKPFNDSLTLDSINAPQNKGVNVQAPTGARKAYLMAYEGEIYEAEGTVAACLKKGSQSGTGVSTGSDGYVLGTKLDDILTPREVIYPIPIIEIPISDGYARMSWTVNQSGSSSEKGSASFTGILYFYS